MKKRIQAFLRQCGETLRLSPAELLLSVFFFVYVALIVEKSALVKGHETYALLFPLFFSASFLLGRWLPTGAGRWAYYLSPLLAVPFLWVDVESWTQSISYGIALAICPLLVCVSRWRRDNDAFTVDGLHYVKNLAFAALLTGVTYGLVMGIYFSLRYIFPEMPLGEEEKVMAYAAGTIFIIGLPLVFLTLLRLQEDEFQPLPILDMLMNYVLSPALLIYTAILYIYFLKILVTWSLPQGGIAYMVFVFTLLTVLAKAYQPLLSKRLYDWFYGRFQWISLPALAMFWIGVMYRIGQYGQTQARVYLLVCGGIMTLTVLMFFSKRGGRYLYATAAAILLLGAFTYIPGITAKEIGIRSQRAILERTARELGLLDEQGRLIREKQPDTDSLQGATYQTLYEAFDYLADEKDTLYLREHYGLVSAYELNEEVLPQNIRYGRYRTTDDESDSFSLSMGDDPVDLRGFDRLWNVSYGSHEDAYGYKNDRDSLWIYAPDRTLLFGESLDQVLAAQLVKMGLPAATRNELEKHQTGLRSYDRSGIRVVFGSLNFETDSLTKLTDVSVSYLLDNE